MAFKGEIGAEFLDNVKTGFTVGDIYRIIDAGKLGGVDIPFGAFVEWKGTGWEAKKDMQYAVSKTGESLDEDIADLQKQIDGIASAIDGVVPQTTYTALAGNTALPLKVDANGKLTNNGVNLTVSGANAWAEGSATKATGANSHAEGNGTTASGVRSHAEGNATEASTANSHAEGNGTKAIATDGSCHAEGTNTTASGGSSHAEGNGTTASGGSSHAEGTSTTASGNRSHAEGYQTISSGLSSHAEGSSGKAIGQDSHVEGNSCEARKSRSHAGGNASIADGIDSFVHGNNLNTTKATSSWLGQFNADEDAFFGVGNGTADDARKNALKVDKNGHLWANADSKLIDFTAVMDNSDVGNEITETPPQAEYTVGNYYFIAGQLCKCTAYSVSTATFEITSLLDALNSLNA